jgi:hypothetical protein
MNHQPVKSSHIRSIAHEGTTLEVEFLNGTKYQYVGVTPEEHGDLMSAESIGTHFAKHIRGRKSQIKIS